MAKLVDRQETIPRAGAACKRAAEAVLGQRKGITVVLVGDAEIAELHERYLGVAGPTDVLSFPTGEIVVSADTAAREARARGSEPLHELVLYVVHGALHLDGFDDQSPTARRRMRAAERRILQSLGYGDVFGAGKTAAPGSRPGRGRGEPKRRGGTKRGRPPRKR